MQCRHANSRLTVAPFTVRFGSTSTAGGVDNCDTPRRSAHRCPSICGPQSKLAGSSKRFDGFLGSSQKALNCVSEKTPHITPRRSFAPPANPPGIAPARSRLRVFSRSSSRAPCWASWSIRTVVYPSLCRPSTRTASLPSCIVPLALLSLAGAERPRDYTLLRKPPVRWADLLVFEGIKAGPAIFQSAAQLAAFNLLSAGVLVEGAFRDAQILGGLRVLLRQELHRPTAP